VAVLILVLFSATANAQLSSEYADWDDGPAGFLLTKTDKKAWKKITTDAQAEEFIELFWARRNPDGNTAFNAFESNFEARVAYADENFGFGDVRGALSDRGKVLILLGGPRQRQIHDPKVVDPTLDDETRANLPSFGVERWVYEPASLPEELDASGAELIFTFAESFAGAKDFKLDRNNRQSSTAFKILTKAPEALELYPDLTELPTMVSIAGARVATDDHMAWFDMADAPLDDSIRVMSELGVKDGVSRPLWVHIELPPEAPALDVLAGRVSDADGELASTFEMDAQPIEGQYGPAYHLSFPFETGSYVVDIAGVAGEQLQFTERLEVEVTDIPAEGTWMSPIWPGIVASAEKDAPLGAAYTVGGWHITPVSGPDLTRDNEVAYFGFLVRPELDENGEVDLKVRIRLKKDGKTMGNPATMPLDASHILGDLYMYGNSVDLGRLPEPGSYALEFKVTDRGSGEAVELKLPMEISGENPFTYSDVTLRELEDGTIEIVGKISNNTEQTYDSTSFRMQLFGEGGSELAETNFQIDNLAAGSTAEFTVNFEVDRAAIKNYRIQHESELE
jgi:GWxTD domain-containing protein